MDFFMANTTTAMVNTTIATTTTTTTADDKSAGVGLIAAFVAVIFFGSNFVPVKKYETGDGLYFQLVLCCGIWVTGLVFTCAYAIADGAFVMYNFHPWAMLGGVLWATGNIMCVPCIQMVGLSIGLLLWGTSSMLWGWAQGRFGLFGLAEETVPHSILNYVGVGVAVVALALYAFIKPSDNSSEEEVKQSLDKPLLDKATDDVEAQEEDAKGNWLDRQSATAKRIIGVCMAIISGLLYGSTFIPVQYQVDNGQDPNNAHYIFSHFCGIFLASIMYFIFYCAFMCGQPFINPKVTIPAFISGIMWAIAQSSWFIANRNLSQVVSYPLVTGGPGLVAAIWGVLLFKEIQGTRNFIMLGIAFTGTIASSVIVALSSIEW